MKTLFKMLLACNCCMLFLFIKVNAQAPIGCGHDHSLTARFALNPVFEQKTIDYEKWLNKVIEIRKSANSGLRMMPPPEVDEFIIPVVFHVIHEGPNHPTNISYVKIQHQIDVLNEMFSGENGGVDVNIHFCLAQDPWPVEGEVDQISWTNSTEPGVMRYENQVLAHHFMTNSSEIDLMGLTHPNANTFSFQNYLNIWTVSDINGEAVFGYSPQPLTNEEGDPSSGIDGVIIRSDFIGNVDEYDVSLWPNWDHGKTLVHEIGHYLRLYHTFWYGCVGTDNLGNNPEWCLNTGDYVCDTPPQELTVRGCFSSSDFNTCIENFEYPVLSPYLVLNPMVPEGTDAYDHLENFMNYPTVDNCFQTFTFDQRDRMLAFLSEVRGTLVDPVNLQLTGVIGIQGCANDILTSAIYPDTYVHCIGETFEFQTPSGDGFSAVSWSWNFGDGTPIITSNLPFATHIFAQQGNYEVTLTAVDVENISSETTINVMVSVCGDINPHRANWLFGDFVSIEFSGGVPIPTDRIYDPPIMATGQTTVCWNDPLTGELLFYSNGQQVWNADNVLISDESIGPGLPASTNVFFQEDFYSNSNKSILCVPFPNHPNEYFIIRTREYEEEMQLGEVQPNSIYYAKVDMNANGGEGTCTYLGEFPDNGAEFLFEGISAIRHANGIDYWIVFPRSYTPLPYPSEGDYLIYLLTENGFSNRDFTSTQWNNPDSWLPSFLGGSAGDYAQYQNGYLMSVSDQGIIYKSEFDASTGLIDDIQFVLIEPFAVTDDYILSPNGQYLYYANSFDNYIHRLEMTDPYLDVPLYFDDNLIPPLGGGIHLELGPELAPDQKIYCIVGGTNGFYVINDPDGQTVPTIYPVFYYDQIPFNYEGMQNRQGLPTFVDPPLQNTGPLAATLTYYPVEGTCFDYHFEIESYYGNYLIEWDFGDGVTYAVLGLTSTSHLYSVSGEYEVTVTISQNGDFPIQLSQIIYVGNTGPSIIADSYVCPNELNTHYIDEPGSYSEFSWTIPLQSGEFTNSGTNNFIGNSATIDWQVSGIHEVELVCSNEMGCEYNTTLNVEVAPEPAFEFETTGPCPADCTNESEVVLTDATNTILDPEFITWYNDLNESISNVAEVEGLCASSYSVVATMADGCSFTEQISLQDMVCCPTEVDINYFSECNFLPGAPIQFSCNYAEEGATFFWFVNGAGLSSDQEFPAMTIANTGAYTTYLTITSPACGVLGPFSEPLTLNPFDDAGLDMTIDNQFEASAFLQILQNNGNDMSFGQDIQFGNGINQVVVTINDATFNLGPGVDIIINENASVTFNRCTFTSCTTWEGFNVRSNSLTTAASGILRMDVTNIQNASNFSVIENARIGIEVRDERSNANNLAVDLLQGGRVYCGRTRFVNCRQAFNLRNATDKASYFKLCQFTVEDEMIQHFPDINLLAGYNEMTSQCRHDRSIGYNYYGCSWTNSMTIGMDNWTNRGIGVHTTTSTFTLTRFTTNNNLNAVQGTTQGFDIGLQQSSKGGRVTLSYQKFQQNHIGAYFMGGISHRVFKNNFVIGRNTNVQNLDEDEEYGTFPGNSGNLNVGMTTSYEGLVVRNTDLMEIAENTFTGVLQGDELDNDGDNNDGVGSDYPRVGIRIRATNTDDMVVRKNTLSKLNYANLANADNAGGSGTSGLRYICNVNTNNLQDFTNTDFVGSLGSATIGVVQQEPGGSNPGQGINQIWPTGNTLSADLDENEDTYIHFRNEGVGVEYWHLDQLGDGNQTPTDALGLTYEAQSIPHSCPSKYTAPILVPHTPSVISGLVSSGLISKADADQYLYVYLLLLDDGNTAALQQYVEDTWGNQVWTTRDQLLSISPYVTSTVMTSVLDNTQVYPHAIAFELLMANPDVLNDPKLVTYLSTKSDPMPEYLIDLLLTYAAGETSRSAMEKELATKRTGHITKVSEALWAMMDYYEDDTYTEASFETVLGDIGTLNAEMAVVEMLLNKGDLNAATIRAEAIPTVVRFGKGEGEEYEAFMDWITLRKEMMSANRDWNTMNASDIAELEALLVHFDTYAASQAMEVLNVYTGTDYFIPPAFGASGLVKRANLNIDEINANMLHVYPNPAEYMVTIELKEALPTQEMCTLIVTDVMGREVYNQQVNPALKQILINAEDWASGLYAFKIVMPHSSIEINGKFDVLH